MARHPIHLNKRAAEGPKTKRLITIHSQKGGVGKTLIGLYLACRLAQGRRGLQGERTVFIDADLTGTSIAEALPLAAPCDDEEGPNVVKTRQALRDISLEKKQAGYLPQPLSRKLKFLNDLLLTPPDTYRGTLENTSSSVNFGRRKLLWRLSPGILPTGPGGTGRDRQAEAKLDLLRVIPSSGLPRHVSQCVAHIYKEGVTEYLESRLAEIVRSLWSQGWEEDNAPFDSVVIDTSAMLRGISRVALNLHKRVNSPAFWSGFKTPQLMVRKALFVSSADMQDVVDMGRALDDLMTPRRDSSGRGYTNDETNAVIEDKVAVVVLNRVPKGKSAQLPPNNEKQLGVDAITLKDDARVRQYFHMHLTSLHEPHSNLFEVAPSGTKAGATEHMTSEFIRNPNRSFVLYRNLNVENAFLEALHTRKLLYGDLGTPGKDEFGFHRFFKGVCGA